jgi:hypothetical protein
MTVLSGVVMVAILLLFYYTDNKGLALRLMRAVNPLSESLSSFTQNMMVSVRMYDILIVAVMTVQGFVIRPE